MLQRWWFLLDVTISVPYLDPELYLFPIHFKSDRPLTKWCLTPVNPSHIPLLTITTECSWRLYPSPDTYTISSLPLHNFTTTTCFDPTFGHFGVVT